MTAERGIRVSVAGRLAALAASGLVIAGCGGSHRSTADCLNERGFLVGGEATVVRGATPDGVTFTLRVYTDAATAERAHRRRPASTARVGRGVVDFSANPPSSAGGPPARPSARALAQIRSCVTRP